MKKDIILSGVGAVSYTHLYSQDFIIEYINRIVEDEKKYEVPTIKLSEFEKKSAIDIISKVDNIHKANIISFIEGLK